MIKTFYKNGKEKELLTVDTFRDGSWIHVEEPILNELTYLQQDLQLNEFILNDALDKHEIPRIEIEDEIVYIFVRYAVIKEKHITTAPMLIAIAHHYVASVTPQKFPRLDIMVEAKPPMPTTQSTKVYLNLMRQVHETYSSALNIITKNVRMFTIQLEKIRNKDIVQFVLFENDLHDFSFALVKINNDLSNIMHGKILSLSQKEKDQIEDILLSNQQLIDLCNENIRTIVNLRDAYSTIMTNNLNRVIKLFTSLTVILTIPTIVSGFFGMNVNLPPLTFFQIAATTVFICVAMFIFFTYQDWL